MDEILFRYYINTALLVYINISNTQKWAGGHAVPSRYGAYTYLYKKIPQDDLKIISRYLTFLMNFHTMFTDKIDEQRYILSGNS